MLAIDVTSQPCPHLCDELPRHSSATRCNALRWSNITASFGQASIPLGREAAPPHRCGNKGERRRRLPQLTSRSLVSLTARFLHPAQGLHAGAIEVGRLGQLLKNGLES